MADLDIKDIDRRMNGAVETLKHELPINQVAAISVPEPRMLSVQVWDSSNVSAVEKAIRNSGLGLNPMTEGSLLRVPVPELNEERRREIGKIAAKYAEQARVAVRNVRRDGMDELKRLEKDGDIGQDDAKRRADEVQSLTDQYVGQIDEMLKSKESEIMQV